jgi:chemotaxis protein CheZ
MDRIKSSADLSAQLCAAEALVPNDLNAVQEAVGSLMSKWPNNRGVYVQLQRLADFIAKTRQELATLRPDEVKQDFIPKATDELDAIVAATAAATNKIMDAADVIMGVAGRLTGEDADKAVTAVTSIYEACTFQDITGQRVTKVVNMLKVIEERIDKMVAALGESDSPEAANAGSQAAAASADDIAAKMTGESAKVDPKGPAGSALEGPALPGRGSTQAEIDAILSEMG